MRRVLCCFVCAVFTLMLAADVSAHWVTKNGYEDYAQHMVGVPPMPMRVDGMPDFDQKQDGWTNQFGQWNWCGPVAVGNCLWWFDSKFEMIKCISLPPGSQVRPPALSDHYSLVSALMAAIDDHDPANVIPFITLLGNQSPGGIGALGITPQQMKQMIENYLQLPQVNLHGHYVVRIIWQPTFDHIYREVNLSQDVIILLGFWQMDDAGMWYRIGGHYLTVAGVDSQNAVQTLSLSDPMRDVAELGGGGVVWNGWLIPHMYPPPHAAMVHNDAGNVSHDYYVVAGSGSPGGIISASDYGYDFDPDFWENFTGQNTPDHLQQFSGVYNPNHGVHTEIEAIVVVCPNFDYGDLGMDYPTIDVESCGPAHPLSEKAWLGECVDAEIQPSILNLDMCDDGVHFVNLPWTPGSNVQVDFTVTIGQRYQGEPLYLNAWKDGNIDGDFDDGPLGTPEDDYLPCDEWVIQDVPVAAGLASYTFCDPGVDSIGSYDLVMRFRLTSQPVGRFGYGGYWGGGASNGLGTYDIDWVLGEVEDYVLEDMQLAVNLQSFSALAGNGYVDLSWVTASETDVDYFSIVRTVGESLWTEIVRIPSQGNSSTEHHYTYRDRPLANEQTYTYHLCVCDLSGNIKYLALASATPSETILPTEYALLQNYPNPFNSQTQITYALPLESDVVLTVYNVMGQAIRSLVNAHQQPGTYTVSFDASEFASGIYLYSIKTNQFTETRKMVLIR